MCTSDGTIITRDNTANMKKACILLDLNLNACFPHTQPNCQRANRGAGTLQPVDPIRSEVARIAELKSAWHENKPSKPSPSLRCGAALFARW